MIQLTAQSKILIAVKPQDFRNGIDGFVGICRNQLKHDPKNGIIFSFINKSKTMVRLLAYDKNGYWLMTKRLSKGRYQYWPQQGQSINSLEAKNLRQLLNNIPKEEFIVTKSKNTA